MTAWTGTQAPIVIESLNNDAAAFAYLDHGSNRNIPTGEGNFAFATSPECGNWEFEDTGAKVGQFTTVWYEPILNTSHTAATHYRLMEDWIYDVVHILPIDYDGEVFPRVPVGSITKERDFDISIWNAFTTDSVITATTYSQAGMIIDTTGTTLASNELRTYTLTVYKDGASTIDCTITLDTSNGDWPFDVVGSRTYAPPVWALAPVRETYQFRSWTFVSENGKEQRMTLRDLPRREVQFEAFITAVQWLTMQHIIKSRRNNEAAIPIFHEAEFTGANYLTGDSVITVDTEHAEYYVDGFAGLMNYNGDTVHFSQILSMTDTSITLTHPLEADMYGVRVFPMMVGIFKGQITSTALPYLPANYDLTQNSGSNQRARFNFETYRGNSPTTYTAPVTFDGLNVLEWDSEDDSGADAHTIRMWEVDFEAGKILAGTPESSARIKRRIITTLQTAHDRWNFKNFVRYHTDRIPFWFSLNHYNLLSQENIAAGASTLNVLDFGFYDASSYRTALAIRHPDGTVDYRLIDSMIESGGTTTITLTAALSNTTESGAFETKISFLLLGRIQGSVSMEHQGHYSKASFTITEVYQ